MKKRKWKKRNKTFTPLQKSKGTSIHHLAQVRPVAGHFPASRLRKRPQFAGLRVGASRIFKRLEYNYRYGQFLTTRHMQHYHGNRSRWDGLPERLSVANVFARRGTLLYGRHVA